MERRRFVKLLSGAAVLPFAGARPGARLPAGDVCRSRLPGVLPAAARSPGAFEFEGTHILAYGAMRELARRYRGAAPLVVRGGGCDEGILAVRRGSADLGGMCCPVPDSPGEDLASLMVARDIKAVVVHPSNPLSAIRLAELAAAARGELTRWSELGGAQRAIAFVIRRHCAEYAEPVRRILLGEGRDWSSRGLFVDTDEKIVEMTARFSGALGVVSWVFARAMAERGAIRALAVEGVTPQAARHGGYPLLGPLSVVFSRWDDARMGPFFDFLYGPEGRMVIARGMIPVSAREAGYGRGRSLQGV
ncbi:MAG: PstS family phosphate ABC transporter substrate-binding protein [Rhodocyclaceae bacterium]